MYGYPHPRHAFHRDRRISSNLRPSRSMGHRRLRLPMVPSAYHPHLTFRQIIYNWSIGVCGLAIASELASLPLRAHTQSVVVFTQAFSSWLTVLVIPYMINPDAGNLGGKVGYVFAGLGFVFTVLLFFYCPETKGLTTDEVSAFCISINCSLIIVIKLTRPQGSSRRRLRRTENGPEKASFTKLKRKRVAHLRLRMLLRTKSLHILWRGLNVAVQSLTGPS